MDEPLVSIVIPVYNRPREIERAVRSITTQSYRNLEVLVVDDASKDNTADVVQRLSEEDPRVKLIRAPANGGSQRASNLGIKAAQGAWIGFLDSDDWYLPGSVIWRLERGLAENVDCVHSDGIFRSPDGTERVEGLPPLSGRVFPQLLRRWGPMYQSLLVRREALHRIGLLDESIVSCQEWDTAISLAKEHTFAFVPKPTYVWDCTTPVTQTKNLRAEAIGYEQVILKNQAAILTELGADALVEHYRRALEKYTRADSYAGLWRCCRRWTKHARGVPGLRWRYFEVAFGRTLRHAIRGRVFDAPKRVVKGLIRRNRPSNAPVH